MDLTQTQDPADLEHSSRSRDRGWMLIESKDLNLWHKRNVYLRTDGLPNELWKAQCTCGVDIKEGRMVSLAETGNFAGDLLSQQIQCDCCDTWQHRHCYAVEKVSLGETHVCYKCLLEDSEEELLRNMQQIARLRRALWIIRSQNAPLQRIEVLKVLGRHYASHARYLRWCKS